jgi:hypothetical protein
MKLIEIGIILSVFLFLISFGRNLSADESEAKAVKRVGPMLLKGQKVKWPAMARFEFNSKGQIQKEWIVRDELGSLLTSGTVKFINP